MWWSTCKDPDPSELRRHELRREGDGSGGKVRIDAEGILTDCFGNFANTTDRTRVSV